MRRSHDNLHINFLESPINSLQVTPNNNNKKKIIALNKDSNISSPGFEYGFEQSIQLQKRLREIKKIAPIDILKQKIQLKTAIPKQRRRLIIDETVRRFELTQKLKSYNHKNQKIRSLSLQHLFKGIALQNDDHNLPKRFIPKPSLMSTKKLFAPCLSYKFETNDKTYYEPNLIVNHGDRIRLIKTAHNPARIFTTKPENSKRYHPHKSPNSLTSHEKTGLLFTSSNNNNNNNNNSKKDSINNTTTKKDSVNTTIFKDSIEDSSTYKNSYILNGLNLTKILAKNTNSSASLFTQSIENQASDIRINQKQMKEKYSNNSSTKVLPSTLSLERIMQISRGNMRIQKEKFIKINQMDSSSNTNNNNNNNNINNNNKDTLSVDNKEMKNFIIKSTKIMNKPPKKISKSGIENNDDSIELTTETICKIGPSRNPLYNPKTFKDSLKNKGDGLPNNQRKYCKLRMKLLNCLNYLKMLKLTLTEVINNPDIFSQKPFEKEGSIEFIQAAKKGDEKTLRNLLAKNSKYLVYDFDNLYQTALHTACKKGHLEIVKILIDHGADLNAIDLVGRTPLYFAIKNQKIDVIKVSIVIKHDLVKNLLLLLFLVKSFFAEF